MILQKKFKSLPFANTCFFGHKHFSPFCLALFCLLAISINANAQSLKAATISTTTNSSANNFYTSNKAPLQGAYFVKLPVTAIKPGGWLLKQLELQRDGLTGNLGEIGIWLSKTDNAWLNKEGKGKWVWEELPYWLKGYGNMACMVKDEKMLTETKFWIEKIPGWGIDRHGLCGKLPQSPVQTSEALTTQTLVPMGSARLRISAFPVVR